MMREQACRGSLHLTTWKHTQTWNIQSVRRPRVCVLENTSVIESGTYTARAALNVNIILPERVSKYDVFK